MGKAKKKSSKVNWKRIRHPDVDNFLIEEREKDRHNFSTNDDDNFVFTVDTKGTLVEEEPSESDALVDLSKLKCYQILKPHSTVPDPLIKRNKLRINRNIKTRKSFRNVKKEEDTGIVDLWDAPEKIIDTEWLYKDTARVNIIINKKPLTHKPTELKAIEVPHPGFSVNPTFGDHQDLLKTALEIEKAAIKAEQKLQRATSVPLTAVRGDDPMLLQGLTKEEDVKLETEDSDDEDKKPMITKLKTKKQRSKEKLLKINQQSSIESKQTRVRESDVFNIKQYEREMKEKEKGQKEKLSKKVSKKIEATKFGQKPLSKWKFEEGKLNPVLSDELSGRLRNIKGGTSSLLVDRFKSFQKRNIVEVRVKQRIKRKHKKVKYQRPSEKMEWEKTGVWEGHVIK